MPPLLKLVQVNRLNCSRCLPSPLYSDWSKGEEEKAQCKHAPRFLRCNWLVICVRGNKAWGWGMNADIGFGVKPARAASCKLRLLLHLRPAALEYKKSRNCSHQKPKQWSLVPSVRTFFSQSGPIDNSAWLDHLLIVNGADKQLQHCPSKLTASLSSVWPACTVNEWPPCWKGSPDSPLFVTEGVGGAGLKGHCLHVRVWKLRFSVGHDSASVVTSSCWPRPSLDVTA